ncbi:hypothetical protein [Pontibacillus sp. HMF3514]|uniref:hypothetical protein n=1 Tax=Pontibacillus sp. HMF3514 TaxID=2692425 RepID=UPI00131F76C8|nr:hypothetical protein [Pontibacillus sp. HMF3514]QHE52834.1 hypothetical protein GS400_12735 [Pontibacillus sp. HMF3514]
MYKKVVFSALLLILSMPVFVHAAMGIVEANSYINTSSSTMGTPHIDVTMSSSARELQATDNDVDLIEVRHDSYRDNQRWTMWISDDTDKFVSFSDDTIDEYDESEYEVYTTGTVYYRDGTQAINTDSTRKTVANY